MTSHSLSPNACSIKFISASSSPSSSSPSSPFHFSLVSIPNGLMEQLDGSNILEPTIFFTTMAAVSPGVPGVRTLLQAIPARSGVGDPVNVLGITAPVDFVIVDKTLAEDLTICHDRGIPFHFFNTACASMTLGAVSMTEDHPVFEDDAQGNAFFETPLPGAPPPTMPNLFKQLFLTMCRTTPLQDKVQTWLDLQPVTSVVYVSFGSISYPSPVQIAELGKALVKVGKPFIWSLRSEQQQHLPGEILSRMAKQFDALENPFLILGWAPQKLILQHASTAVFLSYCGWNCTMEALPPGFRSWLGQCLATRRITPSGWFSDRPPSWWMGPGSSRGAWCWLMRLKRSF
ncbi:putative Anthocyanidin 3-O-glucosyltransferase 7 [Hypsibius exemplaris]|uniref:Anthocyanidin 3-O-glucosyltransferase 7 n=1 Tax=Hypsibius exemplaris TaxID=2072580 RepID=A0A9X6RPJ1_HYPEX|nr:putative Anthocyanidin 3-O-glucosyltransferase 7 [Hypsibius exemplaris]